MSPDIKQAIIERVKNGRTREEIKIEFIQAGYSEVDFDGFFTQVIDENAVDTDNFNKTERNPIEETIFPGYLWFFKQAFHQVSISSPLTLRFAVYCLIFAVLYLFFTLAVIFGLGASSSFGGSTPVSTYLIILSVYLILFSLFLRSFLIFIYALLNRSQLLKYSEYRQKFKSSNGLIILLGLVLFFFFFSGFFIFLDSNLLLKIFAFIIVQFLFFTVLITAFFSIENKNLSSSLKSSFLLVGNNFIRVFNYFILYTLLIYISMLLFLIPVLGLYLYFYVYFVLLFATVIFYEYLCKKNIDTTTKV